MSPGMGFASNYQGYFMNKGFSFHSDSVSGPIQHTFTADSTPNRAEWGEVLELRMSTAYIGARGKLNCELRHSLSREEAEELFEMLKGYLGKQ